MTEFTGSKPWRAIQQNLLGKFDGNFKALQRSTLTEECIVPIIIPLQRDAAGQVQSRHFFNNPSGRGDPQLNRQYEANSGNYPSEKAKTNPW